MNTDPPALARCSAPRRSGQRTVVVPMLVVNSAVHLLLVPALLAEAALPAVLFVVLGVTCLGLAGVLVEWDTRPVWWVTAGVNAVALVACVLSRSIGLPQLGDEVGGWAEPLGFVAITVEALVVIEGTFVLLSRRR